jgi:hypothetical protein
MWAVESKKYTEMKEEWENMDNDFWLPLKYEDPSLGKTCSFCSGYNAVAIKKSGTGIFLRKQLLLANCYYYKRQQLVIHVQQLT